MPNDSFVSGIVRLRPGIYQILPRPEDRRRLVPQLERYTVLFHSTRYLSI